MDSALFEHFRTLIHKESGIALSDEKLPLLTARIGKRLRALGLSDTREYLGVLKNDQTGEELIKLLDVVSTNVTYFYREPEHFVFFRNALRDLENKGKRTYKVWCAAASTGEEPYTLAIEASETIDLNRSEFKMLATDISTSVLKRAIRGSYNAEQIKGVPAELHTKYFNRVVEDGETRFNAKPELTNKILFKRLNLSVFPFPLSGPFDFIFCRNVMIYFDKALRQKIVHEFERLLVDGGYIITSRTESLLGLDHKLQAIEPSIYRKV